jgi:hypothetical protein
MLEVPRASVLQVFSPEPVPPLLSLDPSDFTGSEAELLLQIDKALCAGEFTPTNAHIHWFLSILCAPDELTPAWHICTVTVLHVIRHFPKLLSFFVENGIVSAISRAFPIVNVVPLLTEVIVPCQQACSEAISQGILAELLSILQDPDLAHTEPLIDLAGAFGGWSHLTEAEPIVLALIRFLPVFPRAVIRAMSSTIEYSWQNCSTFLNSGAFSELQNFLADFPVEVFGLFEKILIHPQIPIEIMSVIADRLLVEIQNVSSDPIIIAILHAISGGRGLGDGFANVCFPLVPFLLEKFCEMASYPVKCAMMTCLCGLFLGSSYETSLQFTERGFFPFLIEFADQMMEECDREITDTLQNVLKKARDNQNGEWLEFLLSDEVHELVEMMAEAGHDDEVHWVARGLLKDLEEFVI